MNTVDSNVSNKINEPKHSFRYDHQLTMLDFIPADAKLFSLCLTFELNYEPRTNDNGTQEKESKILQSSYMQ